MMILWQMNARDYAVSEIISRLVSDKKPFDFGFHNNVHASPGLYCFWLRNTCIYVGMSEDLQKRMIQHSHTEGNPELDNYFTTYPDEIQVSLIYLNYPATKLRRIESQAITKLRPLANRQGIHI